VKPARSRHGFGAAEAGLRAAVGLRGHLSNPPERLKRALPKMPKK
jgi:hypothetical protein